MTHFEYLMVIVAIIMGLGITQLLRGFSKLVRARNVSIPVAIWAIVLFYMHVQIWWGMWDLEVIDTWRQFDFLVVIVLPCVLFACVELLMPLGTTATTDWNEHYDSVRKWFCGTIALVSLIALLATWILLEVPLSHPYRAIQSMHIALGITGMFVAGNRAHIFISGTSLVTLISGQFVFRVMPGLQ